VTNSYASELASEPIALCLGWDVGGWHGQKDGLACVSLFADGTVRRAGRAQAAGLGKVIAAGSLDVERLLDMV